MRRRWFFPLLVGAIIAAGCRSESGKPGDLSGQEAAAEIDPLPSWRAGKAKQAIIDFVERTTTSGSVDFVPPTDRIACFDNDGTLWSEQPYYFQLAFAIDRIKDLAPQHPEWQKQEPFKSILAGDLKNAVAGGEHAIFEILMASHGGMTTDDFDQSVKAWLSTAVHPQTGKPYTQMIYRPMLELLSFLRANGFKTFIVSGGGVDFMRVWTESVYGIPPEQVVGSSGKVRYDVRDGVPALIKSPELNFIDDKDGKPIGIHQYIGKRPIFTAGNSDGDYEMLQYTTSAKGFSRFGMIIHHTDSVREWAYDRISPVGKLSRALDQASRNNWVVVDMRTDWLEIY